MIGREMEYRLRYWPISILTMLLLLLASDAAHAQMVRERGGITKVLTLDKITIADGRVSGDVINHSAHTMRDVQLFIRYTWLWDNETKPGTNDPGTSAYYTLPKEIAAGESLPFTFKPSPPLATMPGGHFETSVAIAGFTEVIPQTN
jgi:hypothetical protein